MKKKIHYFLLPLSLSCSFSFVSGQSLEAFISTATFDHPTEGPYIESYLAINGERVSYKSNEDGQLQARVEVTAIFLQGDSIRHFDKYTVTSPALDDEAAVRVNFVDVQRVQLANGVYTYEMQMRDMNADSSLSPLDYKKIIVIDYQKDSVMISDIELVESFQRTEERNNFVKGGVRLTPYPTQFFPEDVGTMTFYAEIYNSAKITQDADAFLLNFYIESQDSEQQLGEYSKFRKEPVKEVNVLFNRFSIAPLPSGNYNLVIEVRDRSNRLVAVKKKFFQRSNPNLPLKQENLALIDLSHSFAIKIGRDSLFECIRCLGPISSTSEKQYAQTQLKVADEDLMRRYLQYFWEKRSPLEPESLWLDYSAQVRKVQKEYGRMLQRGYETDRGRVYLQYGLPNSIEVRNMDPSSYPYEIWHYYKLNEFSNAKFIFYNPELADQRFELLHSNVPGEPYDPAWHYKIQHLRPMNVDRFMNSDSFDSRTREFWSNPK